MFLPPNCSLCHKSCCPNWKQLVFENSGLNLAVSIKNKMELLGMNQRHLAILSGLTPACISQIINGKRKPTAVTLKKITDALGCKMDDVFI